MSRVRYNESLYRTGFRPYGKTDPFAASQLNGMGATPFDPTRLHGVFTERGGTALHGTVWDWLDNAAIWVVDAASLPYNVFTGKLTEAQKQALVLAGQNQVLAVADSQGAQISEAAQTIAQEVGMQNTAQIPSDVAALDALNKANPAPKNYWPWIVAAGIGLLVFGRKL